MARQKRIIKTLSLRRRRVELDQETQILTAYNSVDSLGEIVERANFKQGGKFFPK